MIYVSGADNSNTRELNSLVKVYGQGGGQQGMHPQSTTFSRATGLTRKESDRMVDPERMRNLREGLEKDKNILDNIGKNESEEPCKSTRNTISERLLVGFHLAEYEYVYVYVYD